MRATVFEAPGNVRVTTVPDPRIEKPEDAVVRVLRACICGSDLWFYRGISPWERGWRTGHEFLGIVEDVGSAVRGVERGDVVIAPFSFSDGTCEFCRAGLQTSCDHGGFWGGGEGNDGGQGEAVRVPFADGTLVKAPRDVANDAAMLRRLAPLTDVMGTGHHAALAAGVRPGAVVAVVGDGAVGLCGVLAAKRLGAERIFALTRHPDRAEIAREFGATDIVHEPNDDHAIDRLQDATNGGAPCVLECVGTDSSMRVAMGIARAGGTIGFVGVPRGGAKDGVDLARMFGDNIGLRGGVAPVRAYIPELLADVLAGKLDPSRVLDLEVDLDGVPDGYRAMDQRTATKVLVSF
jgi:threonine dehydrogenase-like Zn-dependent dehydrogenase